MCRVEANFHPFSRAFDPGGEPKISFMKSSSVFVKLKWKQRKREANGLMGLMRPWSGRLTEMLFRKFPTIKRNAILKRFSWMKLVLNELVLWLWSVPGEKCFSEKLINISCRYLNNLPTGDGFKSSHQTFKSCQFIFKFYHRGAKWLLIVLRKLCSHENGPKYCFSPAHNLNFN